jgi:hypothetical protein
MNDGPRIIGEVHAWQEDGQWYYSTADRAPEGSQPAKLVELQGQIVLAMYDGQFGQNVWGAVQVS